MTYGKDNSGSLDPASAEHFVAKSCAVISDTTIRCSTSEGLGFGHKWQISIGYGMAYGAQNTPVIEPTFPGENGGSGTAYAPPMVINYEGSQSVKVTELDTEGNQHVVVEGRQFGTKARSPGSIRNVSYGIQMGDFYAEDCQVVIDHIKIECKTVKGAGTKHRWFINIAGQDSRSPSTGYASPVITGFNTTENGLSTDKNALQTRGGEKIVLVGRNFGPSGFLESVTYGPTGVEYTCTSPRIIASSVGIECTTSAGVGSNLQWRVTVGGQTGSGTPTTSYAAPSITSMIPTSGPTDGGTEITVSGTNFGISDIISTVNLLVDGTAQTGLVKSSSTQEDTIKFLMRGTFL